MLVYNVIGMARKYKKSLKCGKSSSEVDIEMN